MALKLRHVGSEDRRENLLREGRVLLGLTPHPALPLVREDFFEGDQYVIAMDWVDGTRWYAIGRHDGTVGVYDARDLRLVRHHRWPWRRWHARTRSAG